MTLRVTPIDFAEANAFVAMHHRHHKPMPGVKFCIAVSEADKVVGVAMVGRPVARMSDNGLTVEVNRCCTDGTKNACSMLYGAVRRIAKEMGFARIITYTLPAEGGASLRASGWVPTEGVGGTPWNHATRARAINKHSDNKLKTRWEARLSDDTGVRPTIPTDQGQSSFELFGA